MSEQPYMRLWIADFLGDTLHLSDAEVGQYMLILMAMWRNGGSLPADEKSLERIARAPVSSAVRAFFTVCDGNAGALLTQKRLTEELAKANGRSEAASGNAKARWLKNNKPRYAGASNPHSDRNANHSQLATNVANKKTPVSILKTVLDDERAEAVVEHRRRLKAPLGNHAAKLLAGKLAEFPDPNEAADILIGRGWKSIDVGWDLGPRGHGPPPSRTAVALDNIRQRNGTGRPELRNGSGGLHAGELPAASPGPGSLREPAHRIMRGEAEDVVEEDGEPRRRLVG